MSEFPSGDSPGKKGLLSRFRKITTSNDAKKIGKELDDRARQSQNPLFGLEDHEDGDSPGPGPKLQNPLFGLEDHEVAEGAHVDEERSERELMDLQNMQNAGMLHKVAKRGLAATMKRASSEVIHDDSEELISLSQSKHISLSDTDITTIGQAAGKQVVNKASLPPAAAFWFSPDMVKTKEKRPPPPPLAIPAHVVNSAPSSPGRTSLMTPRKSSDKALSTEDDKKNAQLRGELEHVNSIIHQLDEKLRKLAWEFEEKNQDENGEFEKEARKIRDDIRAWELKQWKLIERIDKAMDKEGNRSEIREQDSEGVDVKIITISEGKKTVTAATIDLLVDLLTDETNSDLAYVDDFLLTYRLYLKPQDLLAKISLSFHNTENKDGAIFRVALLMKKWMERYWKADFELESLQGAFRTFFFALQPYLKKAGKDTGEFDLVTISKILSNADFGRPKKLSFHTKNKEAALNKIVSIDQISFLKMTSSPETIAKILATKELELYASVRPEELIEKLVWKGGADDVNPKTTNLLALIGWVNQLGFWLGHEICLNYDLKARTKTLARFIEIAKECVDLGCYNSVFALVTGLSGSAILRLKKTWEGLPKKLMVTFTELENICSPQFNYRTYRTLEAKVKPPFIPFFGMHMRDLLFMNDGKPSKLVGDLMSFSKLRTMANETNNILKFQKQTFYEFPKGEGLPEYLEYILTMKTLEERHLYKLSCLCEPPAWKRKSFFMLSKDKQDV